jgi:MipA family protein
MQLKFRTTALFTTAIALTLATASVQADEGPDEHQHEEHGPQWGLGLGVSSETSPYRGIGTDTKVLPMLSFENSYVRILGPSLDLKLPSAGPVSLALRARYSDQGYKASDAAELQGMDERKGGLWLGARADWNLPWGQLTTEWESDANGRSKGQQIKVEASRRFRVGSVGMKPRLGLVWQDSSYVDYYYGVRDAESRAGRTAYAGKATVNTEIGLQMNIPLAPGHSVFMDLSHTFLGSSIKDSPLVGHKGVSAVRAAYVYRF